MTADERALRAAICAQPADDTPRLVYADWLDERGQRWDADRAAFIRVQCELGTDSICLRDSAPVGLYSRRRARFRCRCRPCKVARRERDVYTRHHGGILHDEALAAPQAALDQLWWTEFATLSQADYDRLSGVLDRFEWLAYPALLRWERGFVAELRIPIGPFREWAGHLFLSQPIERVYLTDSPDEPSAELVAYGRRRAAELAAGAGRTLAPETPKTPPDTPKTPGILPVGRR